ATTADENNTLDGLVSACSAAIEKYCRRDFVQNAQRRRGAPIVHATPSCPVGCSAPPRNGGGRSTAEVAELLLEILEVPDSDDPFFPLEPNGPVIRFRMLVLQTASGQHPAAWGEGHVVNDRVERERRHEFAAFRVAQIHLARVFVGFSLRCVPKGHKLFVRRQGQPTRPPSPPTG